MGPQYRYKYKGEYYNITDLASKVGIPSATIAGRLRMGWSLEEAVEIPVKKWTKRKAQPDQTSNRKKGQDRFCIIDGKRIGVAEVSRRTGLSKDAIYQRLYRGDSLENILANPEKPPRGKKYLYDGKMYTIRELAELFNLTVPFIRDKLNKGYSTGEIRAGDCYATNPHSIKLYKYKGQELTIRELASLPECQVSYDTLRHRIATGWDVEKAVLVYKCGRRHYSVQS